jgi:hypothetical protein
MRACVRPKEVIKIIYGGKVGRKIKGYGGCLETEWRIRKSWVVWDFVTYIFLICLW